MKLLALSLIRHLDQGCGLREYPYDLTSLSVWSPKTMGTTWDHLFDTVRSLLQKFKLRDPQIHRCWVICVTFIMTSPASIRGLSSFPLTTCPAEIWWVCPAENSGRHRSVDLQPTWWLGIVTKRLERPMLHVRLHGRVVEFPANQPRGVLKWLKSEH
jgi:hypothetical protein